MEKSKNLQATLDKLNKEFGKNTVIVLGESEPIKENLLSTGSLLIDGALGGGIGYGRVTEVYGVEGAGKSTLCLHIAAECQKAGGVVAYIDVENALDPEYAATLGVNVDDMIFSQPNEGEQALEICDALAKSGEVNLIILDSVAALSTRAELDGEMSDATIGGVARLMGKALRKLTGILNQNKCAIIFINQLRSNISTGFSMGPSETTPGGKALKYFASQRIELRKTTAIKDKDQVVGNNVKVKIVKNKIGRPMKVVELPLIFGKGFDASSEVIDLAIDYGICKKMGSWYETHKGERFQGKQNLSMYYETHPEDAAELRDMVIKKMRGGEENTLVQEDYEVDEDGVIVE